MTFEQRPLDNNGVFRGVVYTSLICTPIFYRAEFVTQNIINS